ncbi:uncharacterized protein LY89DRAFT_585493 [Mollisia scopiformis]|uniref:Transglycosylase SLT domain-containing protein n=1 Tax=Mollisia scopiformis TaxID=149040 RepID=A0A194X9B7_MOLSC|nr:uncharacterized protein LY89DRAFT_585493 [Mollisia scopiformis]KUJ16714.1 hypothetical protein LY89DRAFT_585493 [Mollisia scopiformis]
MGFTPYSGPASAFPPSSTWKTFDEIFNANKAEMLQTGDTESDVSHIHTAVLQAAKEIGVEERVIFCIIMQESTGNVGVGTTIDNGQKPTGGLMQAEESPAFPGQHNLPQSDITAMVMAGTKHFKGNLEQEGDADNAVTIYEALRLYNSGRIDKRNLSNPEGATASYVSDIANRLQGRTN